MEVTKHLGPAIRALAVAAPSLDAGRALKRVATMMQDGASDFDILTALTAYMSCCGTTADSVESMVPKVPPAENAKGILAEIGRRLARLMTSTKPPRALFAASTWLINDLRQNGYEPAGQLYAERRKWKSLDRTF